MCALIALSGNLATAGLLYNGERVGKAVRTPARDTMLAHASAEVGRGYAFGLHEALDQIGAMTGPLLIAAVLALGGDYHLAFALLAVPGGLALLALTRLRRVAPDPIAWEPAAQVSEAKRLRLEKGMPRRFWHYAAFSAMTMLGFSTWAVLAFHLTSRHLLSAPLVPVLYAMAMGSASIAALVFGRIYDRVGLRGLIALPFLGATVPMLSFSNTTALFVTGAIVWGAGMGVHDSTMRAAVADFVPPHRRGAGYGTFTAIYGLAWLAGAALIGLLYEHSTATAAIFVIIVQTLALIVLLPPLRNGKPDHLRRPASTLRSRIGSRATPAAPRGVPARCSPTVACRPGWTCWAPLKSWALAACGCYAQVPSRRNRPRARVQRLGRLEVGGAPRMMTSVRPFLGACGFRRRG